MKYVVYREKNFKTLRFVEKVQIKNQIADVLQSINKPDLKIEFLPNHLTVLCYDDDVLAGFIHVLPNHDENEASKSTPVNLYVDYIAVAPNYQHQHIASNLYTRAVLELEKQKAETLSAVLLDKYSRRAFENTAKAQNLKIAKEEESCTQIIQLDRE